METIFLQIQVKLDSVMMQVSVVDQLFLLLTEPSNTQTAIWIFPHLLQLNPSRLKLILISFKKILALLQLTQQQHLETLCQLYLQWKEKKTKKTLLWMEDIHTVLMEISSNHQDFIDPFIINYWYLHVYFIIFLFYTFLKDEDKIN